MFDSTVLEHYLYIHVFHEHFKTIVPYCCLMLSVEETLRAVSLEEDNTTSAITIINRGIRILFYTALFKILNFVLLLDIAFLKMKSISFRMLLVVELLTTYCDGKSTRKMDSMFLVLV